MWNKSKGLSDFHVHTSYCDGRDTPDEMAAAAYGLGFHTLGFSSHSMCPTFQEGCMNEAESEAYRRDIRRLQERYRGNLRILCGLELDYHSEDSAEGYDYVIGSVHNLYVDGRYYAVDCSPETTLQLVNDCFGGRFDAYARAYYELAADVLRKTKGDIIGHLDVITKFNETLGIVETEAYLRHAFDAVHALLPYNKPFEINVGAMTRGYRTAPYPSDALLREISRCGGRIIFTGDCHDRRYLGKYFDTAKEAAKRCGFGSYVDWGERGFAEFPLI